ncbi:MAG: neutral zinc metallopeptidase [Planctomycetota bacterium]
MKLEGRRKSDNVIDLAGGDAPPRRRPGKKAAVGGGLGLLVVVVVALLGGGDLSQLLGQLGSQVAAGTPEGRTVETPRAAGAEDPRTVFVGRVLGTTEDVWGRIFREMGRTYDEPQLVSFRDEVQSGCGFQTAQVGPFYCGADQRIYIDLDFFEDLATRHRASGDFAQAYVIAHEVGHHIQNITGVSEAVHRAKRGRSEIERNRLSVRQELHADFLSGVWGFHVDEEGILDHGDLEEALNAAAQIGDDTLQRRARGRAQPESFTHGTAQQRSRWFRAGFETGDFSLGQQIFDLPYDEL